MTCTVIATRAPLYFDLTLNQHSYYEMLPLCSHGCCPNRSHLKASTLCPLPFRTMCSNGNVNNGNRHRSYRELPRRRRKRRGRKEIVFGVDPFKNPRDKSPSDENKNTLS